ncbi:MAG TPA: ribonuclease P [Candidatus Nanoarchaeia archaeon]|nr:ribonuclease P [Candidatus Nanoarchaeia archaeon]
MRAKLLKKLKAKKEARENIPKLLERAKKLYKQDLRLSNVYSKKIKHLHMKYKLKLPKEIRRQLCKHCFSVLIPSVNSRVRLAKGRIIYYCSECKRYTRIPLR